MAKLGNYFANWQFYHEFVELFITIAAPFKEVKFATCSADKSRKLLNYKTQTKLKDAISKTCEFIKKNGVKEFKYYLPVEIKNEKTPKTWIDKLI